MHSASGEQVLRSPEQTGQHVRVAVVAYTVFRNDGRVRKEAEVLASHGYEVHAITLSGGGANSIQEVGGVFVHPLSMGATRGGRLRYLYQYMIFFLVSSAALIGLYRKRRFQAVHVHSLPDFQVFCALPLKLMRVSVVLDLHEAFPEILAARFRLHDSSPLVRLAVLAEKLSCKFADRIVVANDGIRDAIITRGASPGKVTTAYNTPRLSGVITAEMRSPRKYWDFPEHLLVHAGGLNRERDLETLLRAIPLLPDGYHVVLAGDGDSAYVGRLQSLADDLGVGQRVHFVGHVPLEEALSLMSLASVGVVTLEDNPLTRLAWPTRIPEFAGLEKALVLPDLPFIRSVVRDAAVYYRPGDPRSLASMIEAAVEDPEKTAQRIIGAKTVCQELEHASILVRVPALYAELPLRSSIQAT